jgi:hypothetical protein
MIQQLDVLKLEGLIDVGWPRAVSLDGGGQESQSNHGWLRGRLHSVHMLMPFVLSSHHPVPKASLIFRAAMFELAAWRHPPLPPG